MERLTAWIYSVMEKYTQKELAPEIKKYSEKTIVDVRGMVGKFDDQAHNIRKKMKSVFYMLHTRESNPVFDQKEMKILDKVLSDLGGHQDFEILKKQLRGFRKGFMAKETRDYPAVKKTEEKIEEKKKELLKVAKEGLEKLIKG
jgi:CHAD domain-containing protein